jgi:hypothetical protein
MLTKGWLFCLTTLQQSSLPSNQSDETRQDSHFFHCPSLLIFAKFSGILSLRRGDVGVIIEAEHRDDGVELGREVVRSVALPSVASILSDSDAPATVTPRA